MTFNLTPPEPKLPHNCPLCSRDICFLPHRRKPEIVSWSERKSRRGRPKRTDTAGQAWVNWRCEYFAVAAAHQLPDQVWHRQVVGFQPIFTADGLNQDFHGIAAHFG